MSSRVLVVGGSTGIGRALVEQLCAEGQRVVFTFCASREQADDLAAQTGAEAVHYDQTSDQAVGGLAARVRAEPFDALVHNGAQRFPRTLLLKTDVNAFLLYQQHALRGVLEISKAFATAVKERKGSGVIVNVLTSSVLGMPPAKQAAYVTSKYALLGLTRAMAVELVRYGVRVNAVSPGMTDTAFNFDLPERFLEEVACTLPLSRLAEPGEVAAVVRFLISPAASYLNGANIPVTGGQAC